MAGGSAVCSSHILPCLGPPNLTKLCQNVDLANPAFKSSAPIPACRVNRIGTDGTELHGRVDCAQGRQVFKFGQFGRIQLQCCDAVFNVKWFVDL